MSLKFSSILRLIDMIENKTNRTKAYCTKLADSLEKEGYVEDSKCVRELIKEMNGEIVAKAVQDEVKS